MVTLVTRATKAFWVTVQSFAISTLLERKREAESKMLLIRFFALFLLHLLTDCDRKVKQKNGEIETNEKGSTGKC